MRRLILFAIALGLGGLGLAGCQSAPGPDAEFLTYTTVSNLGYNSSTQSPQFPGQWREPRQLFHRPDR